MSNEMSEEESETFVIKTLKEKGPLTTGQVEEEAKKMGKQCPDKTVLVLTKLKMRGVIKGEFLLEERTWKWWI